MCAREGISVFCPRPGSVLLAGFFLVAWEWRGLRSRSTTARSFGVHSMKIFTPVVPSALPGSK